MKVNAIIAAAGQGKRMGAGINKQYLRLADRPVLAHTLGVVAAVSFIDTITVVVAPDEEAYCRKAIIEAYRIPKVAAVLPGGRERQDSVANALQSLPDDTDFVIIHDGARPFADAELFQSVFAAAQSVGAAIPVIPVKDTVKQVTAAGKVAATLDRNQLAAVQTPQVFRYAWLRDAYRKAEREGYTGTDDAALLERAGYPVQTVTGMEKNLKLTTPFDLLIGEQIIREREIGG